MIEITRSSPEEIMAKLKEVLKPYSDPNSGIGDRDGIELLSGVGGYDGAMALRLVTPDRIELDLLINIWDLVKYPDETIEQVERDAREKVQNWRSLKAQGRV